MHYSTKKIVVISALGALQRPLVKSLHERHPVQLVVRPRWEPPLKAPESKLSRLRREPARFFIDRLDGIVSDRVIQRQEGALLGSATEAIAPSYPLLEVGRWHLHSQEVINSVAAIAPDFIVLCGSPVISRELYSLARIACLNVHFGIAPQYRGENTIFWALLRDDSEHVGITIHRVADMIDGGEVFAYGYPSISSTDTEVTLLRKCGVLAATLVSEMIEVGANDGDLRGVRQQERGVFYRFRDRRSWHTAALWFKQKVLGSRPREAEERIERFFMTERIKCR